MDNFYTLTGEDVNEFFRNYRDALKAQRDSSAKQLQQQRRNDFATIMGGANRRGMLYSNFPQRSKIRYDAESYNPALIKIDNAYTTGLDSLRANMVNLWNQKKAYDEAIADLS